MQPGQPDPAEQPEPGSGPWSTSPPGDPHTQPTARPAPPHSDSPHTEPPRAEQSRTEPPEAAPPPVVLEGELLPPAEPGPRGEPRQPPRYRQEPYYPPEQDQPAPEPEQAGFVEEEFTSNMGKAIAMFALFPPFAVPATINARRAALAHQYGAAELAEDNATESRKWSRLAMIFGIISWLFLICCGGGDLLLGGCGVHA